MLDTAVRHSIIQTNVNYSRFDNEPVGIAYLAAFGEYLVITNTSHNTEISKLDKVGLEARAIYNETIYFDDPDKAAFDLDMHAVMSMKDKKSWLMLNHFGVLRRFDMGAISALAAPIFLSPVSEKLWLGDVEQTLLVNDCLISTSPCGYYTEQPAKPGLYVSHPLSTNKENTQAGGNADDIERLEYTAYFTERGIVTAIAINNVGDQLAIAFEQDVFVYKISKCKDGLLVFDDIVSQIKVNFHTRYLSFWKERYLICAGHDISCQENTEDASNLTGGGFVISDYNANKILASMDFNGDLAWGNGGICVAIHDQSQVLFSSAESVKDISVLGIDRQANLIAWNCEKEKTTVLFSSEGKYSNLGLAHLISIDQDIFCGFNRDGARLHKYTLPRIM